MRSGFATALAVLMLLVQGAAGAQEQTPIFRSGVDMTRIKVAVLDQNGAPVPGLDAEDFRVFENGDLQPLNMVLAPADVPLDVAIVIDFSLSIDTEWADPQARDAAELFLDALSDQDCVYLLPFHHDVGPGVWGAADDARVRRLVREVPYGFSTRLHDAIRNAHAALDARAPDYSIVDPPTMVGGGCQAPLGPDEVARRRAAIVVLTDGEDTGSEVQYADVLLASHEAGRPVFAVAVGLAGGQERRSRYASFQSYRRDASYGASLQDRLAELSRVSGGHLVSQREIRDGYDEVLALLRGYYLLGYRTPRPITEGWHGVTVEVEGDHTTVTQPGIYRTGTDYGAVRGALRAASETLPTDTATALRMLELAAQLAPEMATPQFGRGVALERLSRLADARAAYERALLLSPGAVEVRSRLARLTLRLGDYETAWSHALRVQRAGYDAREVLDRLEIIASEPVDREARSRGPRVSIPKPLTPDLEAQLALRPIWQEVGRLLEDDPTMTVVPAKTPADFVIRMELHTLESRAPRKLDLRLKIFDAYENKEEEAKVEVEDLEDVAQLSAAIARGVEESRAWLHDRMRRRR
jgi:VWFA-related protein